VGNLNNTQITIIGLGNLGMNIGKFLLSNNKTIKIVGFDLDKNQSKLAKNSESITIESNSYSDSVENSDILILAVPTSSTYDVFESLVDNIDERICIIDFSSNKRAVSSWANELLPNNEIIGMYPFIKDDSLLNLNWGVINYSNSKPKSIDLSKSFIEEFKGSVINIDINEHDSYIGLVETMPYLLSSVLIKLSHKSSSWKEVFRYFDGKFNEFSSPSEIDPIKSFSSISTNNDMINQWIKLYINELMNLEKQIESNSENEIADFVNSSWEDKLLIKNNIDPNFTKSNDLIPSSQENMLSLFIGSKAAGFFTKSKNIDKDKYGFEKRI
tara:strand:- start:12954 stop:13937 length:984 start_codon:yes stop_codon:yes gene_type:complete